MPSYRTILAVAKRHVPSPLKRLAISILHSPLMGLACPRARRQSNIFHAALLAMPRVLYIEDAIPFECCGRGLPRARRILLGMNELGLSVTFFPMDGGKSPSHIKKESLDWPPAYASPKTEVVVGWGLFRLRQFLAERRGVYQHIFVSRPHNMQVVCNLARWFPSLVQGIRIVYDAEAVFSLRDELARELKLRGYFAQWTFERELDLARSADCVTTVSQIERRRFQDGGVQDVRVLGHALACLPTPAPFDQRRGILFVGSLDHHPSPNSDSVLWFVENVLRSVQQQIGDDAKLLVVGRCGAHEIATLRNDSVKIVGPVDDLDKYFNACRIFVAPTRFAAGIPLKVYQAASLGLPAVVTGLLAGQLGWTDGCEVLSADHSQPEAFARRCVELYSQADLWSGIRERALARVAEDCSERKFVETLAGVFGV